MPAEPREDDGLPPRDEDGRFTTAGHHGPAPGPEPEPRYIATDTPISTLLSGRPGPMPEPEPEMVKVRMHNATHGARHPGQVITLPAGQARELIRDGLASRA